MTVYVDDMCNSEMGRFGRMRMSHMVADTPDELLEMADLIGVQRKWIQHAGTHREHFDIAKSKRALALRHGAIAITMNQYAALVTAKRFDWNVFSPEDAEILWRNWHAERVKRHKAENSPERAPSRSGAAAQREG